MARITIRIPDSNHQRLKQLVERQGLSLNKLIKEWSNIVLAQSDAESAIARQQEVMPWRD